LSENCPPSADTHKRTRWRHSSTASIVRDVLLNYICKL